MVNPHLIELFWARVQRGPADECWLWTGTVNSWTRYGTLDAFRFGLKRQTGAHRVSALIHFGPPPFAGAVVMHTCDNPPCVNPSHLRYGSVAENNLDAREKGRWRSVAAEALRAATHCQRGHAFTAENTYVTPRGRRQCRVCAEDCRRRWEAKNPNWKRDLRRRKAAALTERTTP